MDVPVIPIVSTLEELRRTRLPVFGGCAGCGACLLTCPTHAIRPIGGTPVSLSALPDLCTGCGECVEVCPVDAISLDVGPR